MELVLDASTGGASLALVDGTRVLAETSVVMRGTPDDRLTPAVVALVEGHGGWGAVGAIWTGAGPGSFTSLRIAAAFAKGVALARQLRLCAMPSLALVAADPAIRGDRVAVALDAMRGEVFFEIFRRGPGTALQGDGGRRLSRDAAREAAVAVGATLVGIDAPVVPRAAEVVRLRAAGLVQEVPLDSWEPDYGRLAEAQVVWEAKHGRPLDPARPSP